jgi:hypothetical protein
MSGRLHAKEIINRFILWLDIFQRSVIIPNISEHLGVGGKMFRTMWSAGVVCLIAVSSCLFAQQRVDSRNLYERVLAVVPIVGSGSPADPIRPLYAPQPSAINPASRAGILGYTWLPSDDGTLAIVEFVAADRAAFKNILADTTIKTFLKGRDQRADVLTEILKHRKNFDIDHFGVRMP